MKTKLQKIAEKYLKKEYDGNNYAIGGGLDNCRFASNRHEAAKADEGKVTLGNATQMFAKATGLSVGEVKEVIHYAVPTMEWHHAGLLPKAYGGGMKKTYFLNSAEIVDIAINFEKYQQKIELRKKEDAEIEAAKKDKTQRQQEFLQANAKKIERTTKIFSFFYETNREMNGKYGWFCSYGKDYKLDEYLSGWVFESEEKYKEFLNIK